MRSVYRILIVTIFCFVSFAASLSAQQPVDTVYTINGTVSGARGDKMQFVNVVVKGTGLGTVTNEDGRFSLKVPRYLKSATIQVSHLGYYSTQATVDPSSVKNVRFTLNPHPGLLEGSSIISYNPETLIREMLKKIGNNYPNVPVLQRGFYREMAQKGSKYISISEAVTDTYKTIYLRGVNGDRTKVLKGRRILSQKSADTLSVKVQGGPNLSIYTDVVKNSEDLFYEPDLEYYNFQMEESAVIGDRAMYVVSFTPRIEHPKYPLYRGRVYIDKENLALMRAEYSIDMTNVDQVTTYMLRKKPSGMKFVPQEISYLVNYRYIDDVAVLHYIRSIMRFKCDWKKRLFNSSYTLTTEMVSTDFATENIAPIPMRESFKDWDIFYDKVDAFYDDAFWESYNIIEPSESLEHAVLRLRKRSK